MGQDEEPTSSKPYEFACDENKTIKGKKKAPSSNEEEEEEDDDQASKVSYEDEETVRRVEKIMRMICKINLMGVPLQAEDLLFNIGRKKQRKRVCFACGEKGHFRDNLPNSVEPKKRRSKGKTLTSVNTWDDSSSKDEPPRTHIRRSSSHSSRSSHKCLMARGKSSIPSSSDDSDDECDDKGKPSLDELVHTVMFLRMFALNKRLNLKL
jgi:hypothetical protein